MPTIKRVGICWAVLAGLIAIVTMGSGPLGLLIVIPVGVVAIFALTGNGQWAGAILTLGGIGLSIGVGYVVMVVLGTPHGVGSALAFILGALVVVGVLGLVSVVVGIARLFKGSAVAQTGNAG